MNKFEFSDTQSQCANLTLSHAKSWLLAEKEGGEHHIYLCWQWHAAAGKCSKIMLFEPRFGVSHIPRTKLHGSVGKYNTCICSFQCFIIINFYFATSCFSFALRSFQHVTSAATILTNWICIVMNVQFGTHVPSSTKKRGVNEGRTCSDKDKSSRTNINL